MIIDAHLHLDDSLDGDITAAVLELDAQLKEAGISHAVVLHLESQPWSAKEFSKAISNYPRLHGFINVHPYSENPKDQLSAGIRDLGFIGLKLHPRLQEFDLDDARTVELVNHAGDLKIPVLIDAFPDGTHLIQGFSPLKYSRLAVECRNTKFIWAHMGGHFAIDFMMLAKRLPNVSMDLSYSLLYFDGSSIPGDLVYCMRSMKFDRIFYGSDYPDRSVTETLNRSMKILKREGLSNEELSRILGGNAQSFFNFSN